MRVLTSDLRRPISGPCALRRVARRASTLFSAQVTAFVVRLSFGGAALRAHSASGRSSLRNLCSASGTFDIAPASMPST